VGGHIVEQGQHRRDGPRNSATDSRHVLQVGQVHLEFAPGRYPTGASSTLGGVPQSSYSSPPRRHVWPFRDFRHCVTHPSPPVPGEVLAARNAAADLTVALSDPPDRRRSARSSQPLVVGTGPTHRPVFCGQLRHPRSPIKRLGSQHPRVDSSGNLPVPGGPLARPPNGPPRAESGACVGVVR